MKDKKIKFRTIDLSGKKKLAVDYGKKVLLWQRELCQGAMFVERIDRFINFLINLVLILFGVLGILVLTNAYVDLTVFRNIVEGFFDFKADSSIIYWMVLTWGYLIYRLNHRSEINRGKQIEALLKPKNNKIVDVSQAFDVESEVVVNRAWQKANNLSHERAAGIHLLLALLDIDEIKSILARLGVGGKMIHRRISSILSRIPRGRRQTMLSVEFQAILIRSFMIAEKKGLSGVSAGELMLALVTQEGLVKDLFYDLEIDNEELNNVIVWLEINQKIRQKAVDFKKRLRFRHKSTMDKAWTAVATPFLDQFGQDLTALAREGYLQLCVARDREIEQIFRLVESGKRGVIMVGYPDVGKTTIAEGIAQLMVGDDVPRDMRDKRLVSLSIANLVAGGSEIGEIEGRLRKVINEINRAGNVVLFINDIHNMTGVTTSNGELDLSAMMAEVLEQNTIITLATSDPVNYRRYIQGEALGQGLSKVDINEPDENQAIQILESKVGPIEYEQEVYFSYDALRESVELTERYIQDRYLPKKAVDILEEVAVYVRQTKGKKSMIQGEDVAQVISDKLGIPTAKIKQSEADILLNLEDKIHERLIDQVQAVDAVANALRRARTELRDIKKPISNLLFLGPTGVGKTELAKTVAALYFGSEDRMIRLDMSEYQEQGSIDRLIGEPGETGGGLLTEAVRKSPYSLLLLDEIEKAHPDILNIFLQVLDDGRLTDNEGRTVDFTNLIIIATSNAGTQFIQEKVRQGVAVEAIKDTLIRDKLQDYFRPEFLNRFDDVVVFKTLAIDEIEQIAGLFLRKLKKQMLDKGVTLKITPAAVVELARAGFDPEFGARPLKRAIQERVNNALAQYLLTGKIGRRDVAIYDKGGVIRIEKAREI